jgi:AraC-like DNA-binding protein
MTAPPIRMSRFSTDDFPAQRRVAAYCEIYGETISRHDLELTEGEPFHFTANLCSLPGLGLTSGVRSPCKRIHGPQHIDHDDLLLGITLRQGCVAQQFGREAVIDEGDAVLLSGEAPLTVETSSTSQALSLRIPSSVLRSLIPDLYDRLPWRIPRDSGALRLLAGYVEAIPKTDAFAASGWRDVVVRHVHDLVALLVEAQGDARHAAEARGGREGNRAAILRSIEQHSRDPRLNASTIAAQLGITPRYVHLLLEETGRSFSHHLLERRLEKAAALLRDPALRNRRISEIAHRSGFTDLSSFNRSFRRYFGLTPTDVRAAGQKTPS